MTEDIADIAKRLGDYEPPLIVELRADPSREAAFWGDIAKHGAPLIEPDPASPNHSLVTFVWRLDSGAEHVVVQPAGFPDPADHLLQRVPGTSTCHATYRYRNDVRMRYCFVQDMPIKRWRDGDVDNSAELNAFVRKHLTHADPYNAQLVSVPALARGHVNSLLALPDAPDESVVRKREGVARGQLREARFASTILDNERALWVYTPPGYEGRDHECHVVLVVDGEWYTTLIPTHRILDNLAAEGKIPPTVAVLIDNATPTSRDGELACNEGFAQFVSTELIPWVKKNYRTSDDPARWFAAGSSLGGLCATWLGYRLPHQIGNVISQAGAFWWGPESEGYGMSLDENAEWLTRELETADKLPIEFWLEVGLLDQPARMVGTSRRLRDVLIGKGYAIEYREYAGGHDFALWRGTLAEALAVMLPSSRR